VFKCDEHFAHDTIIYNPTKPTAVSEQFSVYS
jgi:hypothetical protein